MGTTKLDRERNQGTGSAAVFSKQKSGHAAGKMPTSRFFNVLLGALGSRYSGILMVQQAKKIPAAVTGIFFALTVIYQKFIWKFTQRLFQLVCRQYSGHHSCRTWW